MAVWERPESDIIDYSPTGDDVDSFVQKADRSITQLFQLVNILHNSGTTTGLDSSDAVAGEIRVNLADKGIYVRSEDNLQWHLLGYIAPNLGITPSTIGAIANGGDLGTFYAGTETAMNQLKATTLKANDIWIATDTWKMYRWTGTAWVCFLSKNFKDILDYEQYCVSREEVATSGKGKVLKLDPATGKANVDITGSPERLDDIEFDFQNLRNGHAIVYNADKNKWVNLPNYIFTKDNLTYTGETSTDALPKIVAVGYDGKIHGDFTGNTDHIGNIEVVTDGIKNNWLLVYNQQENRFVPVAKVTCNASELQGILIDIDPNELEDNYVLAYNKAADTFIAVEKDFYTKKDVTTKGDPNKLVKVEDDGYIYGKFNGQTTQIGDTKLEITNLQDGDVFVYHESTDTIKNEPKNTISTSGSGKSLILYDREKVIGDYNGSRTVKIDISKVISRAGTVSYVNQSMRLIENLYLACDFNELNFGGRDGLYTEFFKPAKSNIDNTSTLVTSIAIGDDSIDVSSAEGLIVGGLYWLVEGNQIEEVRIKEIKINAGMNRVIFENLVSQLFTPGATILCRTMATFGDGYITGDNAVFITKLFKMKYDVGRANMTIKHDNVPDTEITAEMATHHGSEYVKGEVIGIGNGTKQTVKLANPYHVATESFKLYFDGVEQTTGFEFSSTDAEITFNAANNVVVQADYIYNFESEDWIPMYRNLTYPDTTNEDRMTTQFHYAAEYKHQTGKNISIRIKIQQNSGTVTNEVIGVGNDKPQGFKLPHHAIASTISVSPSTATWTYKEDLDTVIITAADSDTIKISYDWKARPLKIDSMAVILNE